MLAEGVRTFCCKQGGVLRFLLTMLNHGWFMSTRTAAVRLVEEKEASMGRRNNPHFATGFLALRLVVVGFTAVCVCCLLSHLPKLTLGGRREQPVGLP